MSIDGIRLFIVCLIYSLPVFLLSFLLFESAYIFRSSVNPATIVGLIIAVLLGTIVLMIFSISVLLIVMTAGVRFAYTDSLGEAFNFGDIFTHIGRIGWMTS